MTNFNEELEKIIIAYHNPENLRWVEPLAQAITELVKGIVPEEQTEKYFPGDKEFNPYKSAENCGFNSCRTEMLSRLEEDK